MSFIPATSPPAHGDAEESLYFLIKGQEIVVKRNRNTSWFPSETDILKYDFDVKEAHFIGTLNGRFCYALEFPKGLSLFDSLQFIALRDAFTQLSSAEIQAISIAKQVLTWDRNFRFCGRCGQPTIEQSGERAKLCTNCGLTNYPRLCPSIIVSVIKDDQILLARSDRFPDGMYSVLAGFVEPGETLEECVRREVAEEVGIEVHNIQYIGSQNWPFPHSLMIGFTAEYLKGEISIDNDEIVDAQWFTALDFPRLPGSYSIARKLIDRFRRSRSAANHAKR
jgi:NAD+ diphosphatase